MNQASNSSMPRSTAEALKQIQKQGLSISVVVTDSKPLPVDSSVSKETRVKAMPVEKATKIVVRSNAGEKTVMLPARATVTSPEIRNSMGQSSQHSNQVVYQENKVAVSKPSQPMVSTSDSRAFGNQSWSNQPVTLPSDSNKPQGISRSSHMISVVPDKIQAGSMARVSQNTQYVENKLPVSRVVPVTTHDNKNQVRSVQMAAVPSKLPLNRSQNQHVSFDIKPQKSPLSSPPSEVKVFAANTVARPSKVYLPVHENKGVPSHNMVSASSTEVKSFAGSSKMVGRGVEKSTVGVQRNATVKGILADKNSQVKPDSRSTVDQLSGSASAAASDRSANIPFRVASALPKKAVEEKSSVKISRVAQSTESHSSVHLQSAKSETVSHGKLTSDPSLKAAMPPENSNDCSVPPAVFNTQVRGAAKRPLVAKVVCRPPLPKKKCVKRDPDQIGVSTSEACTLSSDEGSPEKGKKFLNLKSPSDLTITPVRNPSSTPSTSGSTKVPEKSSVYVARCHNCKLLSSNLTKCDSCNAKITSEAIQYFHRKTKSGPSFVVTKNITTSIKKEIIYTTTTIPSDGMSENQSYHFKQAVEGQVTIEGNQVVTPRGKGRPRGRRKYAEPECYTLSSDEDENASMQFNSMLDDNSQMESQMYHDESDGSNLEHSSGSDHLQDENEEEMDDPMFPGVTEINEEHEEMECEAEGMEDEEEEELEYSGEEEEEVGEDEDSPHEDAELENEATKGQKPTDYPLRCRSIRIGSYKVHPLMSNPCVPVQLARDCLTFQAPVLTQPTKIMSIRLKDHDIRHVMAHFGRCLPIMFIFTSASFGEAVRNALNMTDSDPRYFDPTSKDEKTQKLTFLIENLTEDQRNFIRSVFPGEKKLKEMDQKTANEILVKSTPHQPTAVKLQSLNPVPTISVEALPPVQQSKQVSRAPVVNLFTYPPPPQTGGIAITNEDLACLNEGEFLNDAIIDFYLKYVFYEKLTPAQREKTHIFSSYFYPRLTHKPERPRSKDDAGKTMQVRRHDQVKTWTRHVDIFSKDFIIIPVNQNVHWFLAIICYPGRVPEAPEESVQPESKGSKSADNVSSTVEQEEVQHKVVIKEISPNGDNSDQEENSNSNSDSSYQVEEPPDSDEPTAAESPDSTTHPDGKKRDLPCICIFDSLCGPNRWRIASTLREYLEMEWKMKKGTKKVFDRNTMQGFIMKCPQQTNYSDCGTYVLQYVESFFENPIQFFRAPMPDLTNWFSEAKVSKKRQQLQELILSLQKKLSKNNPSNITIRKINPSESVPSSPASTLQTDNR